MSDEKSNGKHSDFASPRLRGIIDKARSRRQVFKEIDLSIYDPGLANQVIKTWCNAPSALARYIGELEPGDATFVPALAEYLYREGGEPYTASDPQDLLDMWEGALRPWIVREIFDKLSEYNQERADFFERQSADSSPKV